MEGPLKEAELGGPELDPIREHIWAAEVGGAERHHSLSRSWEAREWDSVYERTEILPLCSLFSAGPCLLAQWLLNQTDLDPTPHAATLKLCDPRQVSEPLWALIFNL